MNEDTAAREVAREQEFVDGVYRQLDRSAASAQALAQEGHSRGRLGHEGGLVERDAMVFQAASRLATLDAAHEGLVFGRLDMRREIDRAPRYIGRIGLRDDDRDVLLIDWRAPAAAVFYQATPPSRGASYAAGCCAASASGCSASRTTCSTPRPGRPADRRRGRADGPAVPGARPLDALDRGDHPGRAGRGDPRAREGRRHDRGRPGHRQDGGRAAPRRVPALHRPPPLRDRRRARGRARRASSCATSSGCCRRSARPRSRCARSARSSTASAPSGATTRRSPRSRARAGWPRCSVVRRARRCPARPRSSASSTATTCSTSARGSCPRSGASCSPRPAATGPPPGWPRS